MSDQPGGELQALSPPQLRSIFPLNNRIKSAPAAVRRDTAQWKPQAGTQGHTYMFEG